MSYFILSNMKYFYLCALALLVVSCEQNPPKKVADKKENQTINKTVDSSDISDRDNAASVKSDDYYFNSEKLYSLDQIKPYLPNDYTILDTCTGDLNRDSFADLLVVLKKNREDSTSDITEHPEKRPLLLFLRSADSSYQLAARKDNVVLCIDGGGIMGDPYAALVIKNGYFSVEHYGGSGWRWKRITTFKYVPAEDKWYLHKDASQIHSSVEPEKVFTTVWTTEQFGKVRLEDFNIYEDGPN